VRHQGLGTTGTFWSPPGGGVQFGEKAYDALIREFLEETGLIIDVEELLFINEFMAAPLHAIELFFQVKIVGGVLQKGYDPEMAADNQHITDVQFVTFDAIKRLPEDSVHAVVRNCQSMDDLFRLRGYLCY
jgi:ADP-ribose pyrophosphatase YjhB (NUDIX family)